MAVVVCCPEVGDCCASICVCVWVWIRSEGGGFVQGEGVEEEWDEI